MPPRTALVRDRGVGRRSARPLDPHRLQRMEGWEAERLLRWAVERFHPSIGMASSFGVEDVVVMDLLLRIRRDVRLFTLDTGRLPEETYELMERIRERYGVQIEVYFPERDTVEALEQRKGLYSFRHSIEDRKECCRIRKVEPLLRALQGLEAWITGLRREQATTRRAIRKVEPDADRPGMVKLNPIADWNLQRVWAYVREHDLPYNALHDRGFPSIGCAPCTRAVREGEEIRAGRWWWESPEQKECGLHSVED